MSYLTTRNGGTYWFQIRVPKALVTTYGAMIRQCLQTRDVSVAQPLALRLASYWMERFAGEKLARQNATIPAAPVAPQPVMPGTGLPPAAQLPDPVLPPMPSVSPIPVPGVPVPGMPVSAAPFPNADASGAPTPATPSPTDPGPETPPPAPRKRRGKGRKKTSETKRFQSVQDLYQYWKKIHPECSPSTYGEMHSVAEEVDQVVKKPPKELLRQDIARYRDHLIDRKLARATVAKRVGFLGTMLQAAFDSGLLTHNVARGMRIPRAKVEILRRRPFTPEELRQIFTSPVYGEGRRYVAAAGEAAAWVPLLALVTGARLEELCQLRVADIHRDATHGPLIRITDEGEGQRVKTMGSRRQIPVHPDLVRAGFLDYVELVDENGHDWLFPELEPDHDGRRGGNFSKWFARYLRSPKGCDIHDQRVVFHSFRHTFKTLCRESGSPEEIHDAFTGHSSASVGRSYGHVPLKALVEAMSNLELPVTLPRVPVGGA